MAARLVQAGLNLPQPFGLQRLPSSGRAVNFSYAQFSSGTVAFSGARFPGSTTGFRALEIPGLFTRGGVTGFSGGHGQLQWR